MTSQLIFADSESLLTLFAMKVEKDVDINAVAVQLALDATERRRSLDSYIVLATDNALLEKVVKKAGDLTFGRVTKLKPTNIKLTTREKQVADLICNGMIYKEIATHLGISISTVKFHVHNLLKEHGAPDRYKLASMLAR